jgi:tetratricopeptide (TPR) repeat protein
MRSASEAYPSGTGYSWYFWCRRNGRGDERAAADLAARYFAAPIPDTRETHLLRGAYCLLQSDLPGALEQYQRAGAYAPNYSCTFAVAQIARELGDEQTRLATLDAMEKAVMEAKVAGETRDAKVDAAGMAIIELMRSGDASKERLDTLESLLTALDSTSRTAFAYHVAKELDHLKQTAQAELWYRHALVLSGREALRATLAGAELVRRHGTSRPNDDVLDETDLWPAPAEEKPKE